MVPDAAGRGQHFQARGHSFSLYGPTLGRQITDLFFSCGKLTYKWVCLRNFVIESAHVPSAKNLTSEQASKLNSDTRQRKMC